MKLINISILFVIFALSEFQVKSMAFQHESNLKMETRKSTNFFKTHNDEIDIKEEADRIYFANRKVGLEFRKSATGFELLRIYDIVNDQDFLTKASEDSHRNLFEIQMALDPKFVGLDDRNTTREITINTVINRMAKLGKAFTVGSHTAKSVSWSYDKKNDSSVLRLFWKQINLQEEKNMLDVEVTIRLRAGDSLSYWKISVNNKSKRYGIERVRMPILPLAPIGTREKNVFLFPKWRGGYLENPFTAPAGLGENYHTTGAYYPYYTNMQFWALYNKDSSTGIYFGTQDPKPCMTHCLVNNTSEEINWSVSHFPDNISFAEEDFELPYECVAGPFNGDWYDACQIYREWAIKQTWCSKGPLATRNDIPVWYKESPLYFYTMTNDSATGTHSREKNIHIATEHFKEWLKWADLKLPLNFYGWGVYKPNLTVTSMPFNHRRFRNAPGRWKGIGLNYEPSGNYPKVPALPDFSAACKELRKAGGMVSPYVCIQLFDQGPSDNAPYLPEAKAYMSRDLYGGLQTYPGMKMWFPCVCTEWWQQRMVDTCTALMDKENAVGVYLDVMHGIGIPCYWVSHGHDAAGGSTMTDGMHTLTEKVRKAMKAKDSEVIVTGEDSTENMIDVIDGVLYQRTLRPENKYPMFGVIYNDFIPRYGLELTVNRPKDFFIECASLFVEGAQVGRLRIKPRNSLLLFDNPEHQEMINFLEQIVSYYKQDIAKKFLVYGQLLRPLQFTKPSPMPEIIYGTPSEADVVTDIGAGLGKAAGLYYPALMSGVFRASDGDLGIFIVNTSNDDIGFQAEFDPAKYGTNRTEIVRVESISPEGSSTKVSSNNNEVLLINDIIGSRKITMYKIKVNNR